MRRSRSIRSGGRIAVAALAAATLLPGCTSAGSSPVPTDAQSQGPTPTVMRKQQTHYRSADAEPGPNVVDINVNGGTAIVEGNGVENRKNSLTITAAGSYRLRGTLTRQLVVDAGDGHVQIIMNGVSLTSSSGSPFVVKEAGKVTIVLADGTTNLVSDANTYSGSNDSAGNATIDSAADLSIAGTGSLNVVGNSDDAISSADGLVIADGNLSVTAAGDGIRGKDYVVVDGGSVKVDAKGVGIKSDNDSGDGRGYIRIDGGNVSASAEKSGIRGVSQVHVANGNLTVDSGADGIESQHVLISGGRTKVKAGDDGLNAAGESIRGIDVTGGDVTITADGDGIDSNASARLSGGTLTIFGPQDDGNGAIDVDDDFIVTGGTLWAIGSSGMATTPSKPSTQPFVSAEVSSTTGEVNVRDAAGKVVGTCRSDRQWSSVIFSAPELSATERYEAVVNGAPAGKAEVNEYRFAGQLGENRHR